MSKNVDTIKNLYPQLDLESASGSAIRDMAHRLDRFDAMDNFLQTDGGKWMLGELRNEAMSTLAEAMLLAEKGMEHEAATKLLELKPILMITTAFRGVEKEKQSLEETIKTEIKTILGGSDNPV